MTLTSPAETDAGRGLDADDGRRARRDRNREAVVDALLDLYREGNLAPSSDAIAERAGLSPRSLFRYFDDIDDLTRAAIALQQRRVVPLTRLDVDADATLEARITALVEQRTRVFEAIGSVGQVSRIRAPFQPLVGAELTQARAFFRGQIKRLMGAELSAIGPPRAAVFLSAADVMCSYEAYQLLRADQGLSRAKAASAMSETLTALFATRS